MMLRPALLSLALSLPLFLAVNPARAAPRPRHVGVRLTYERGPGAHHCPDVADLRSEIAAQLGRDPFTDAGPWRLTATVSRRKDGAFVATTDFLDSDGLPTNVLPALVAPDCRTLLANLAVRIEIVLTDPPLAPAPPPAPALPPPLTVLPAVAPIEAPRPPSSRWLRLGAGNGIEIGTGPTPTPMFSLNVGLALPPLSIAFEARTDLPLNGTGENGARVHAQIVSGSLLTCFHGFSDGPFFGCAMFTVGALVGADQRYATGAESALYSAAGARLGVAIPFASRRFAFHVEGDVLGTLHPIELRFDEQPVWRTGSIAGALQAGFFAFL
jgi:hypothetical protein